MKNRLSLLSLLLCTVTLFSAFSLTVYAEGSDIGALADSAIKSVSAGKTAQEWLNGELTENAGISAEWFVIALRQSEEVYNFTSYADALSEYLESNTPVGAVTCQRYALALTAAGHSGHEFVVKTLDGSIGAQGVMSWIFGINLLNNGLTSPAYSPDEAVNRLLELRLPDGGWALSGSVSDIDVTAMAIQALAPHRESSGVDVALGEALALLSSRQLESGGFTSYGAENAESSAQVIMALAALGFDAETDSRFIKNGNTPLDGLLQFRLDGGGFSHTSGGDPNPSVTAQALLALTALRRVRNGLGNIYVFDGEISTAPVMPEKRRTGYKLWACLAVTAAALVVCLILFLTKKRRVKNFVFVLAVTAAALLFILLTDFQSADGYYGNDTAPPNPAGSVTVSVRCDAVAGETDTRYIPADGIILAGAVFEIAEGDTVYDVLVRASKKHSFPVYTKGSGGMVYVSGINYLSELQFGSLSGWVFRVNGEPAAVGCGEYRLKDGDIIEWIYTK